jgi:hypothetical protein
MTISRRWLLRGALIGGFVACFGCNPMLFPMFLQGESFEAPTLKRLAKQDKKEVTVVILVSSRLDARQELMNVNRELGRKTVEQLRELTKAHDDKLVVVEPGKVDRYLASHPGLREKLEPDELAEQLKTDLKADYIIDIEINSLSLYEGTHELLRGRGDIHVTLINTNDLDDRHDKDIRSLYPKETSGPVMADSETNVLDFRSKFLDTVAKTIAYCFCDHPTINQMDDSRQGMPD